VSETQTSFMLHTYGKLKVDSTPPIARLDYCNSSSHGTSVRNLNRLQVAQNELPRQSAVLRGPTVPLISDSA